MVQELFCRSCSGSCCVGSLAGQGHAKNVKLHTPIVGGYRDRPIDRAGIDADDACVYAWATDYDPDLTSEERGPLAEKANYWPPEARNAIRGVAERHGEMEGRQPVRHLGYVHRGTQRSLFKIQDLSFMI